MEPVVYPWLAEIGIITWRTYNQSRVPLPSEFLATFVVFGFFGFVGRNEPRLASALGWGIVIASWINLPLARDLLPAKTQKASSIPTASNPNILPATPKGPR